MAEPPRKRQRRHLILVRTPKEPLDQDPYTLARLALADSDQLDLQLHHLAILETAFCNQDKLRDAVQAIHSPAGTEGSAPAYDGVIMTSARSVEAFCAAQTNLATSLSERPLPAPSIPFFVVGHPTCSALQKAPCPPCQEQVLGAEECGTGERLAEYIIQHFRPSGRNGCEVSDCDGEEEGTAKPSGRRRPRLLYLTGDKNRDTIPRRLSEGGIELEPLQVYSTSRSPGFVPRLEAVLAELDADLGGRASEREGNDEVWFALFSPSGATECLAEMRKRSLVPHNSFSSPAPPPTSPLPQNGSDPSHATAPARDYSHLSGRIRFAAIGPVTEQFLRDQSLPVHAVARKPEPAALLQAVAQAAGP
ncbi:hypothetical protein JCM10908_007309 [Rhodotorula pacifica]|uniref:uroporphyrinogen-III synthase HEM4 n=1 Tax=Rhodotorula pacifica TaxID=1495444 RepID=UPI00317DB16C